MMIEFLTLAQPHEALNLWTSYINSPLQSEIIDTVDSLGRVIAKPIYAPHPLPEFHRSSVDGYAVRAEDTFGAGESLPAYFRLSAEVLMGVEPEGNLLSGECALIHTGGMLPRGANAVVMLEYTQLICEGEVEIHRAVAVGENIIQAGEDIKTSDLIFSPGKLIRHAEIGGLMALGITNFLVYRKPRVGIISGGDEIIPPFETPKPGQVRDVNAYTLIAIIEDCGGIPRRYPIVPDDADSLFKMAFQALQENDMVVITSGSSASNRDITSLVINRLGSPGVLVHGVNIRPGKPTILAVCEDKPVVGLPGNPVSALVIAWLFVRPAISKLAGINRPPIRPSVMARLSINLPSQSGREEWIPVKFISDANSAGMLVEPVFGKSNLIFTLVRADGLVRIPSDATGFAANQEVQVYLL